MGIGPNLSAHIDDWKGTNMGIGPYRTDGSLRDNAAGNAIRREQLLKDINPNPFNFKVTQLAGYGDKLGLVWVNYPNCKNYEGDKILLVEGVNPDVIPFLKELDPHFTDTDRLPYKVIARFEPTEMGWTIGIQVAKMLSQSPRSI